MCTWSTLPHQSVFFLERNACLGEFSIQRVHPPPVKSQYCCFAARWTVAPPRVAKSQALHCGPHQTWHKVCLSQAHFLECALRMAMEGWHCSSVVRRGGPPWLRSGLSSRILLRNSFTDEMVMTRAMTHRKGIRHKQPLPTPVPL